MIIIIFFSTVQSCPILCWTVGLVQYEPVMYAQEGFYGQEVDPLPDPGPGSARRICLLTTLPEANQGQTQ